MEDCIFCKIASGQIEAEKIYENDNFFSIADASPVAEGHTLVISKKHFATTMDIPDSLGGELLNAIKNTALVLMKKYSSEGFNILGNNFEAAGQEVKHFHVHILPRKKGDGVKILP